MIGIPGKWNEIVKDKKMGKNIEWSETAYNLVLQKWKV
jgi:hypothetical protein